MENSHPNDFTIESCEPTIFLIAGYTRNKISKDLVFKIYKSFLGIYPDPKFILYNNKGFIEFDLVSLPFYLSNKNFKNELFDFQKFCNTNKIGISYAKKLFFKFDISKEYSEYLNKINFFVIDLAEPNFDERLKEYARE